MFGDNILINAGNSILKVNKLASKVILGTVQMGLDYGINNSAGKISFSDSCDILKKANELGINTLDTAEAYGNAHQVIGDFHKLNSGIKFNIITKVPHGVTGSDIEKKVHTYINDLGVEFLEVLMFHSFDSYQDNKDILVVLNDLKNQGIIKHIGVSVYTNPQIEVLLSDPLITVVQMPFNLLDNGSVRGDLMRKMKKANKIVHTRSAFLQGLFFKEEFNDKVSKELANELTAIKTFAKEENVAITDLALSYCLLQDTIDNVLIGVDSEHQLIENVRAANYTLSSNAVEKIEAIKVNNIDLLNPSLWK